MSPARMTGLPTGENIFQTYVDSFENQGGNALYAWEWWYEGSYQPYDYELGDSWSMPKTQDSAIWGGRVLLTEAASAKYFVLG